MITELLGGNAVSGWKTKNRKIEKKYRAWIDGVAYLRYTRAVTSKHVPAITQQ
jgi:hypothetical protein